MNIDALKKILEFLPAGFLIQLHSNGTYYLGSIFRCWSSLRRGFQDAALWTNQFHDRQLTPIDIREEKTMTEFAQRYLPLRWTLLGPSQVFRWNRDEGLLSVSRDLDGRLDYTVTAYSEPFSGDNAFELEVRPAVSGWQGSLVSISVTTLTSTSPRDEGPNAIWTLRLGTGVMVAYVCRTDGRWRQEDVKHIKINYETCAVARVVVCLAKQSIVVSGCVNVVSDAMKVDAEYWRGRKVSFQIHTVPTDVSMCAQRVV